MITLVRSSRVFRSVAVLLILTLAAQTAGPAQTVQDCFAQFDADVFQCQANFNVRVAPCIVALIACGCSLLPPISLPCALTCFGGLIGCWFLLRAANIEYRACLRRAQVAMRRCLREVEINCV